MMIKHIVQNLIKTRRPITVVNRRKKKQLCLDCNGAVATPAFTSNDPTCFAGFDMGNKL